MYWSKMLAKAVIEALSKGDYESTVSALGHMLEQRTEDDQAVATIFDLLGFAESGLGDMAPLAEFLDGQDDVLANAYVATSGLSEALRTESTEYRSAQLLKEMGCPRSSDLAIWRINTKWHPTEHFARLREELGWRPDPSAFAEFAAAAGRWKARPSDFCAALSLYLQTDEMIRCPFPYVDAARVDPLVATLNAIEKTDRLSASKLRIILEIYRRGAGVYYPDNFAFVNMLVENHGLERAVGLLLNDLHEDFLLFDLGL